MSGKIHAYLLIAKTGTQNDGKAYCDVKVFDARPLKVGDISDLDLVSHEEFENDNVNEAFHLASELALSNLKIKE